MAAASTARRSDNNFYPQKNTNSKNQSERKNMKATVLYGPRDVRFEERETPKITKPTDAIIRISATCVCGSDLWPYRGLQPVNEPTPMGHEYCGIVEEVGSAVRSVKPGQFVRSEEHTSELQSQSNLVCRLLLEKKKNSVWK